MPKFRTDGTIAVRAGMVARAGVRGRNLVGALAVIAATTLVRTARRSAAEALAGKRVAPIFNLCAGGKRFDLSGTQAHGVLAEALFKMRSAAAPGTN